MAPAEPARRAPLPRFGLVADAGAAERSNDDIVAELAQVAEAHAPDGGYGETAWNAETGTVFWQCADWSGNEAVDAAEAAFRAVEGVREFEWDAEGGLPYDYEARAALEGWEIVWPSSMTASAATTTAVVDLPALARGRSRSREMVAQAMQTMAEAFRLVALEDDEPAPPQQLHVHLAAAPVHVKVDAPPAAPTPSVHVTVEQPDLKAPDVHLNVEAAAPAVPTVVVNNEVPVPEVNVDVAAPEVRVEAPVEVNVEPTPIQVDVEVPRPGPIRVEREADGSRVYIPEPAE